MSKVITLAPVGEFVQNENLNDDYYSRNEIAVPFLNGQKIDFNFARYEVEANFLLEAEKLLQEFFQLDVEDRNKISSHVWENCREFLEAVGYHEEHAPLYDIQNANEIWQFVKPSFAQIMRDDATGKLFLLIYCGCLWEDEHGLQLTLREGKILTAVSAMECYCKDDGLEINLLDT